MTGIELKQRLQSGGRVYGTCIASPSPVWPRAWQAAGVDFAFLDTEHIPQERFTLSWMCQTYRALGIPPIVRMRRPDPYRACQLIDDGAVGVIAPYVESAEQVRALVGAVKYRPLKGQRLEQALLHPETLNDETRTYLERHNENNLLIVNIESVPARDCLDEILAVPGLDAIQLGPHDLTINMGIPEQYKHPEYHAAVLDIIGRARARGLAAAMHFWDDVDMQIAYIQAGANIIIHSHDHRLACRAWKADVDQMRQAAGDLRLAGGGDDATTV